MSGNLWGEEDLFDTALMNILHRCGKMQPFFECIFSFLSRRTDFYIIMEHKKAKMGFPQGVALNMVMQVSKENCSVEDNVDHTCFQTSYYNEETLKKMLNKY